MVKPLKGEKDGVFDAFGDMVGDRYYVKGIDWVMLIVGVKHSEQWFFIADDIVVDEMVVYSSLFYVWSPNHLGIAKIF